MKLRRLAIICLTFVFFVSGISAIQLAPAYAATITMVTEDLNTEELSLGDEYNFPATIQAEYNSQLKVFANGVVVFPSGKTALTGKKLTLSEVGQYTVRYFYNDGTKRITAERKFIINDKLYNLSKDDGSTIEVVKDNPINTEEGYRNFTVSDGLKLSIKDGNEFVYNKVIDLRETVDGTGASKIAWFDPAHFTTTLNTASFENDKGANCYNLSDHQCDMVYFRITDAYDPSIYVDISVRANKGNFKAGGSNQVIASWDEAADPYGSPSATRVAFKSPDLPDGTLRLVRLTHNEHSQTSRPVDFKSSHNYYDGFKLYYDLETNRVLYTGVNVKQNGLNGTAGKDSGLYVINDLQLSEIYGNGKNGGYFPGFTTGEVRFSIFAANYYSTYANVDLIGVGNDEGKDLIANHGEFSYADTVAPVIDIDAELTDETGVYAAINETYVIPAATATDVNLLGGKQVTDISVYRGYGTDTKFDVPVTNGSFKIKYADIYTIVYRARDTFGNVTEKTLNVTAVRTDNNKAISLTYPKLTETLDGGKLKAGTKFTLPEYTLTTINNVNKLWIKERVIFNGQDIEIDENGTFIPFYKGTYTIQYEYGDNATTKVESYEIECVPSADAAMFIDTPVEYRYFIPNKEYTLEPFHVHKFDADEPRRVLAETWVKVDGADAVKVADITKWKVPATATESVQFVYRYAGAEDLVSKVIPVHVIDNTKAKGFVTQFFAGDFTIADKTQSQVRYEANATSGNATLYYINPISLYELNLKYIIPSGFDRYDSVKFTFVDFANENNKITVRLVKDGNDCLVYFQDEPYVKATEQFTSQLAKVISYNKKTEQFKIGSGITFDVNFGFESKLVYVEIELENIKCQESEKAGIIVTDVGNQKINGVLQADSTAPFAAIDETRGTYNINDIVTVYVPTIMDAITPVVSGDVYIRVTDKNGTVLRDIDTGVLLDMPTDGAKSYRIKLETYGQYTVTYGIRSNVPASKYGKAFSPGKYYLTAIDSVKPEIEFTDGYNEYSVINVKYGDSFTVNYAVTDNLTESKDIAIIISALRHENQVTYYFIENATFTPTEKGTYTITVSARDADNNIGRRTLTIVVA